MKKIGVPITKENIREYSKKHLLVITKEAKPEGTLFIPGEFKWENRKRYVGISGYSGVSGFRSGDLEQLQEVVIKKVTKSGECCLIKTRSYYWGNRGYRRSWDTKWYTVDSLLDVYFFIEVL